MEYVLELVNRKSCVEESYESGIVAEEDEPMICRAVDNLLENTANINGENGMDIQRLGKIVSLIAIVEADMLKRGAMNKIIPIPIRVCHTTASYSKGKLEHSPAV